LGANGSPAFAVYKRMGSGRDYEAYGLQVIEPCASEIGAVHTFFDSNLFALFDLPLMTTVHP
jgi:hypothetical protein